jgi:hypothetical protein
MPLMSFRFLRPLPACLKTVGAVIAIATTMTTVAVVAHAAEPVPEVRREPYPAKPDGEVHTIRIVPEACVYLHGVFTGEKAVPYRYGAKRTNPRCQPRAQLVDPTKAAPSTAGGWILNDIIRIPRAACPAQTAVIRVWRKPADNTPPPPDAQGRSRIYLGDSKQRAEQGKLAPVTKFAAVLAVEGDACK